MRAMLVVDGVVSAIHKVNEISGDYILAPDGVGVGWIDNAGVFEPPAPAPLTDDQIAYNERGWRDAELRSADVEILKLEDAGASATSWRSYRQLLRDWPTDPDFPSAAYRPVQP